ncbi:restriction endonuclease [Nostoc sp. FACHB-87]|uniref:DpnII family type II restriction endonuclease n=1 Tax=Nostocaceae TaxID=1162 RepID=UPI0016823A46|nr:MULTISPECIES: DpnII family type II restriction endonuclease [Nostocaceae]MBD2453135.1 restriction endonuclease [Nostoc sp. FACHB-87]MBD2475086.1 restriction endonuclease [Anabaena sp. FACHB-83]
MINYRRSYEELEKVASKHWPSELLEQESEFSIIPILIETQAQFISILSEDTSSIENLFTKIESSNLPTNLFLKHLVILSDFGGEPFKNVNKEFATLFPDGILKYYWQEQELLYEFKTFNKDKKIQKPKFSNGSLKINDENISLKKAKSLARRASINVLTDIQKDAIALLLFGSGYSKASEKTDDAAYTLAKCEIGSYLGKPDELKIFINQRYIYVSPITKGAKFNTLGQVAQKYVAEYIKNNFHESNVNVKMGGDLPNVTHTDDSQRGTSFDIVVSKNNKYVAIEVSFQETTNSVVERKSGQFKFRYEQIEDAGHKIAYVIDGLGNFRRKKFVENMCSYSHCTVAFSENELKLLCEFLKSFFEA